MIYPFNQYICAKTSAPIWVQAWRSNTNLTILFCIFLSLYLFFYKTSWVMNTTRNMSNQSDTLLMLIQTIVSWICWKTFSVCIKISTEHWLYSIDLMPCLYQACTGQLWHLSILHLFYSNFNVISYNIKFRPAFQINTLLSIRRSQTFQNTNSTFSSINGTCLFYTIKAESSA